MGQPPGPSQRCLQCRKRRKKCGLEQPQCLRCVRVGVKCSGPIMSTIFIHRNADNLRTTSDRNALKQAMQIRAQQSARRSNGVMVAKHQLIQQTSLSLLESNSAFTNQPARLFYSTLVAAFRSNNSQDGMFTGDRVNGTDYSSVALCIRSLLPLAFSAGPVLDAAMFSLLTVYLGRLTTDSRLVDLSQSAYTVAVGKYRHKLAAVPSDKRNGLRVETLQLFLLVSTALQLFEFVKDPSTATTGFLTHFDGWLALLKLSGARTYQAPSLLQSFCGLRGIICHVSIEKREPIFLASREWIEIPFLGHPKQRRDRLHDIGIHIPELLHRTDDVLTRLTLEGTTDFPTSSSPSNPSPLLYDTEVLMDELSVTRDDLQDWLDELRRSFPRSLYWWCTDESIPEYTYPVDPQCIPDLRDLNYQLRFPEGQKAGLLVTYWSYKLDVLAATLDIQQALLKLTSNEVPLNMVEGLALNRTEGDYMALLITQAEPYLTSCLEGKTVIHFPLRVASRYLARYPRPQTSRSTETKSSSEGGLEGRFDNKVWIPNAQGRSGMIV